MNVENLINIIGADFYTGVPDSQLKALCDYLMDIYGIDKRHHIIAANEGNCTALAAGYNLATGKIPVVYMQNSGEGNIINPLASLLSKKVYAIPVIFIIGWRGEPGNRDEPQHIHQGEVTIRLLSDMSVDYFIIDKNTADIDVLKGMNRFKERLKEGKSVAFVIRKDALEYSKSVVYKNDYIMSREEVIQHIIAVSGSDPIICTTGKASRELFEARTSQSQPHHFDFLTVGSMGHSSSIALGIAFHKKNKIWAVDGDGAALMHMGSMALIGANAPDNLVHILINNEAHDTVGGMPTISGSIDFPGIAKACGYPYASSVMIFEDLDKELKMAKERRKLSFIEIKTSLGARGDLGRPSTSALENKINFIRYLNTLD